MSLVKRSSEASGTRATLPPSTVSPAAALPSPRSSFAEGERHQDGGLPGPVRAHQGHHFAAVQGQGCVRARAACPCGAPQGPDTVNTGARSSAGAGVGRATPAGAGRGGRGTRDQGAVVDGPPRVGNRYERCRPVLRHDDADTCLAGEGVEDGDDASACCGVQVGQGLVHQEQRRLVHHRGGDGHQGCLTRREGADIPVQQRRNADLLRDLRHPGLGGPGCHAAQLKGEGDLVPDPGAGERGAGILQDDADQPGGIARRRRGAVRSRHASRCRRAGRRQRGRAARRCRAGWWICRTPWAR